MSFGGGTINGVHSPLGDVCGPLWTYMHWDSSVPPISSAVRQVEAISDHCSSLLHHISNLLVVFLSQWCINSYENNTKHNKKPKPGYQKGYCQLR